MFGFVFTEEDEFFLLNANRSLPLSKRVAPIALVAKEWRALAMELHSEWVHRSVLVDMPSTRCELIRLRSELRYLQAFVVRMRIAKFSYMPSDVIVEELLACVPRLEELHLQQLCVSGQTDYPVPGKHVGAIFRACPQLRALVIDPEKSRKTRDAAIFRREFARELTRSCPLLTSLEIRQRGFERVKVTDGAVRALASLSALCFVRMDLVVISGEALFELVAYHAAASPRDRVFEIKLWDDRNDMVYYDALAQFLARLADCKDSELPCASRSVQLHLLNFRVSFSLNRRAYFAHVRALAQRAHAKHPALLLKGYVNWCDESGNFGAIDEFTFATQPSERDLRAIENENHTRIDDVFAAREDKMLYSEEYWNRAAHYERDYFGDDLWGCKHGDLLYGVPLNLYGRYS